MSLFLNLLITGFFITTSAQSNAFINFFTRLGKGIENEVEAIKHPILGAALDVLTLPCGPVMNLIDTLDGDEEEAMASLKLQYKTNGSLVAYELATAAENITNSVYNRSQNLYIFIHGYTDSPTRDIFTEISDALINKGYSNVFALDIRELMSLATFYAQSIVYGTSIGQKLSDVLVSMVSYGVNASSIHIIGQSVGAHIAGFTGKHFQNRTGYKFGRITGLDPAQPCYSNVDEDEKLSKNDAQFVDVIHTNAGVFGIEGSNGHADFYPNGGREQPECYTESCNHAASVRLFVESVANGYSFPAVWCEDWDQFKDGLCDTSDISYMGFGCNPTTRGLYYLQTGDASPYSLGEAGLQYRNDQAIIENIADRIKSWFG